MTAQIAGAGAAIGFLVWIGLNLRHLRAVTRWAQSQKRARISWDDQARSIAIASAVALLLGISMILQMRWAFALSILLAAAGTVVESAVRVVPHLKASEQPLAMDHIVMSIPLLVALILAVMGWNRLPSLVLGA